VATSLSARLDLPADPERAWALLTDPGYVEEVAVGTGGQDPEVSVTPTDDGGAAVVSARSLPAEVPSYAKPLVGDSVRLTETRTFGPAAEDGSRDGTLEVGFGSAPVSITGTLRLQPGGLGTEVLVEMSVKASVPFVGGKVEKFCAEQIERALGKEEQIIHGRLD
jgi:hypothetical protein